MNNSLKFYYDIPGLNIHASAGAEDAIDWVWSKWNNTGLMLNTAYETPNRPETPDKGANIISLPASHR